MQTPRPLLNFFKRLAPDQTAWEIFCIGAFLPFLNFGCAGYFGFPDWHPSWFGRFEVPLFILGFLCCAAAPCFASSRGWNRLYWSGLGIVGYLLANGIASFVTLVVFGLPMD